MCPTSGVNRPGSSPRALKRQALLRTTIAAAWVAGFVLALAPTGACRADDAIVILPTNVELTGEHARQQLLVQRKADGQLADQVTEGIEYTSSDANVVRVDAGVALPVGEGTATITAKLGNQSASIPVTVKRPHGDKVRSFRNHVQSVLAKAGCNSGACHGAAAGKNGFKLSLRGYDPEFDYFAITRQSGGRRIVPSDPGRSLFLTKPTGAVPHKGGIRFEPTSLEYQVLAEWIAAGQPAPLDTDPKIVRLEVLPEEVVLKRGSKQQIIVRAHFTDGHVEDVTRWAKFSSSNLSVATVDDFGHAEVIGSGTAAVVAWYLANNVVADIAAPYPNDVPHDVYAQADNKNFIDAEVLKKLENLRIPPSGRVDDAQFMRRAFLDTIGVLPTADEVRAFLADAAPDKRERLVDALLARPEFVDCWTYKWSDLLLVSSGTLKPAAVNAYYAWIRQRVEENTPGDQFVREIVVARGSTLENGAANFYTLHEDPLVMAETASMAFLGMSINCARCHDHPLEKWTNDDYYGMANLFARVRGKGWGGERGSGDGGDGNRSIFTVGQGELIQPRTGKPQPPRPLDGKPVPFDETSDRRIALAEWITGPENPYFTRAIVNRVWANFLGVGLVEKVDDLRVTNPPSNEELMSALSRYLVENKYDLKKLMRAILTSGTYQRSSRPTPGNESDDRYYSRYYPRRLKAEVLLDAVSQVTGAPTKWDGYPEGTRALQLRDTNVSSYFLTTFGRPTRTITCECERSGDPSMVQVLHILNGDTLNAKLDAKGNRIDKAVDAKQTPEAILDEAFLSALSRFPTSDEKSRMLAILSGAAADDQRAAIGDLYWSILSSKVFLFNH